MIFKNDVDDNKEHFYVNEIRNSIYMPLKLTIQGLS